MRMSRWSAWHIGHCLSIELLAAAAKAESNVMWK